MLLSLLLRDVEAVNAVMGHILFTMAMCHTWWKAFHCPVPNKFLQISLVQEKKEETFIFSLHWKVFAFGFKEIPSSLEHISTCFSF